MNELCIKVEEEGGIASSQLYSGYCYHQMNRVMMAGL